MNLHFNKDQNIHMSSINHEATCVNWIYYLFLTKLRVSFSTRSGCIEKSIQITHVCIVVCIALIVGWVIQWQGWASWINLCKGSRGSIKYFFIDLILLYMLINIQKGPFGHHGYFLKRWAIRVETNNITYLVVGSSTYVTWKGGGLEQ